MVVPRSLGASAINSKAVNVLRRRANEGGSTAKTALMRSRRDARGHPWRHPERRERGAETRAHPPQVQGRATPRRSTRGGALNGDGRTRGEGPG